MNILFEASPAQAATWIFSATFAAGLGWTLGTSFIELLYALLLPDEDEK